MMILEDSVIPCYILFATKQWLRDESMRIPVGMAETGGEGRKVVSALGWFDMVIGTACIGVP